MGFFNQQTPGETKILAALTGITIKLDSLSQTQKGTDKKVMALSDQVNALQSAVADVKQSATDEGARVDKIIATLQAGAPDNPVVAQAISDLGATSAALKAFHADAVTA